MVTNKRAPLVCLSLYIQQVQAFLKAAVVRSSCVVEFPFEDSFNVC